MRSALAWARRQAARPALHFVLLGLALWSADRWLRTGLEVAPDLAKRTIIISASARRSIRDDWTRQAGRAPTAEEERALIAVAVDEEILYREAVARGLDRDDRVVRTRLAQLAAFVGEPGGEEDLAAEARRLGLDRSDLVVRRYLVQTMRLIASRPSRSEALREDDVASWFAAHRERFRQPPRMDLAHVYVSRDRRGGEAERDAAALLQRLRADRVEPGNAGRFGDPFIRGTTLRGASPSDLERTFGPGFAEAVGALAERRWEGPIRSAYGLHLVWVDARTPEAVPSLDAVRNQVVLGLAKEREQQRLRRRLDEWRRRYVVRVAGDDA